MTIAINIVILINVSGHISSNPYRARKKKHNKLPMFFELLAVFSNISADFWITSFEFFFFDII